MLGARRQLSLGSVEEDGPPLRRRRTSITQTTTDRHRVNDTYDLDSHDQQPQLPNVQVPTSLKPVDAAGRDHSHTSVQQPTLYYQPSSSGPIFNAVINGNVRNNLHISTLDGLQFLYHHAAMGAIHESNERFPPPLCHPGTRDVVIGRVVGWYLDKNGEKKGIMWVHAPAGYGKTAIAGTVKEKLDAMALGLGFKPVGATFFFWRTSPERNSPARFVITLAYQLAQSIPELRPHVEDAVKSEPDIVKMALEIQLVKLIADPFKCIPNLDTIPIRFVIVDGIDECINGDRESRVKKKYAEDQETVQIRVLNLIQKLQSHRLPLSFLILSRPEAWIKQCLELKPFLDVVEPLDLYKLGDHMNDVKQFVRAELSRIATSFSLEGADEEWPEEQALVQKSEGHMIYAATAIRHIDDEYGDPRGLLKDIVGGSSSTTRSNSHSTTPLSHLHELYRQIMRSCPDRNRKTMLEVLAEVLILNSFEDYAYAPALGVLDRLSGRFPGCGVKALRPLHAVLRIGRGNEGVEITQLFIHSSFKEFLESPHLSFEFVVKTRQRQNQLLSTMLDCMIGITTDTIGSKLEDITVFSLNNWCRYWRDSRLIFLKSKASRIDMMKKILALDLAACVIEAYRLSYGSEFGRFGKSPSYPLFDSSLPVSKFFVEFMELDGCGDTLFMVHEVTSHVQQSLDNAFTLLLHSTTLPAFPLIAIDEMVSNCCRYLSEVVDQPNWRENRLVQALALGDPGLVAEVSGLFRRLEIDRLCGVVQFDGEGWARNLLQHICQIMVREKDPILEEGVSPLRKFLHLDGFGSETDSGSDSE